MTEHFLLPLKLNNWLFDLRPQLLFLVCAAEVPVSLHLIFTCSSLLL